MRRWRSLHATGGGVALGLFASGHAWLVFVAGVIVGALIVLVSRQARRLLGFAGALARRRLLPLRPPVTRTNIDELEAEPAGVLSPEERERERLAGLRQGEAAGIRAAARAEARDRARLQAIDEALDERHRQTRRRSVERALKAAP